MTLLFIFLSLVPSFVWLIFFLREDFHPEPKKMLFLVFILGALSILPAYAIQKATEIGLVYSQLIQFQFLPYLLYAAVEEILKFIVVWIAISRSRFFDEPVDAMIYMITAALGFALIENIATVGLSKNLHQAFATVILRFVGATLLHALSSALVGYYWARALVQSNKIWPRVCLGLIIASILHAAFNYLIINSGNIIIYPTLFLITTALMIFWDFEKIKGSTP